MNVMSFKQRECVFTSRLHPGRGSLVWLSQGNVAPERKRDKEGERGSAEEDTGWRKSEERFLGEIESQPQNMSQLSSSFLKEGGSEKKRKISIPVQFLPARGGAGRNYRNVSGVFPTLLRCSAGTHTRTHTSTAQIDN